MDTIDSIPFQNEFSQFSISHNTHGELHVKHKLLRDVSRVFFYTLCLLVPSAICTERKRAHI